MKRDEINDRVLMPHGPIYPDFEAKGAAPPKLPFGAPRTEKEVH
jgi:hypothetical protein